MLKIVGATMFRTYRCIWMLEELGVSYQHITAQPRGSKARKYSELGKIPILVECGDDENENDDDAFVMTESSAINTYLGDKYQSALVPRARSRERGRYDQAISCISTELDAQGLWIHRKHEALKEYFGCIPEAVAHAKEHFERVNGMLAGQVQREGPFLLGKEFTAADIMYVHCLDWAESIGWWSDTNKEEKGISDVDEVCNSLLTYLKRCRSRPAYLRTKAKVENERNQKKTSNQESHRQSSLKESSKL